MEEVAGNQQAAGAGPAANQANQVMAGNWIKPIKGLIKDEKIGLVGKGSGKFCPLPHAL